MEEPDILVEIKDGVSDRDCRDLQIRDNQRHQTAPPLTIVDMIRAAKAVYKNGMKSVEYEQLFGRPGRKLFAAVVLDARHPELEIIDRLLLPIEHPRFLPWSKINFLSLMLNNAKISEKDLTVVKSVNKSMNRYNISVLQQCNPNPYVRSTAEAILEDNIDCLLWIGGHAVACACLKELMLDDKELVTELLKKLSVIPPAGRNDKLKKMIKSLGR